MGNWVSTMKRLLLRCLFYFQVHRLMRYLYRNKTIILMYHGFTDRKTHEGIENYHGKHLYVEKFRSQMKYLKKHYNVISLDQLVKYYTSRIKIPKKSVVITIDDGYKSSYTLAYPILKQFDIPATIFLATNFIDRKEPLWTDRIEYAVNMAESKGFELRLHKDTLSLDFHDNDSKIASDIKIKSRFKLISQELRQEIVETLERSLRQKLSIDIDIGKNIPEMYRSLEWNEVSEMIKSGIISIGSHTHTHVILTRCSPENMKKELFLSKQIIEKKTGLSCRLFCYPNGAVGDFDQGTKKLLKELGYSCGLTNVSGLNDKYSDVFELKRLSVGKRDLIEFIMMLCDVVNPLKRTGN